MSGPFLKAWSQASLRGRSARAMSVRWREAGASGTETESES